MDAQDKNRQRERGLHPMEELPVVAVASPQRRVRSVPPLRPAREIPGVFRLIGLLLPPRLWKEDLGDALEILATLERSGSPLWQWRLKIVSTCFWLLINTIREVTSVVHGSSTSTSKGGDR